MYKPVRWITTINDRAKTTVYFFIKQDRTLIPVNKEHINYKIDIMGTLTKIFDFSGIRPFAITINALSKNCRASIYLCKNKEVLEIDIDLIDALKISKDMRVPIFLDENTIENDGIFITRKIIENALDNRRTNSLNTSKCCSDDQQA